MFDFGLSFSHIVVIVLLAVIVIGPKDLPVVLRRLGQFMNKMRGMAREFQGQVDIAMKDAGMDGIQKDLQSLKSGVSAAMNPVQTALSGAATSLMDEPKKSLPATASAEAPAPMMASLPNISPNNDFTRIFNASSEGETRVQGRGLDEAKP
jgi:sec-independent protein translocase protein TatB